MSAVESIVTRSRAQATSQQRTFCGPISELDNDTLKSVVNHLGYKEKHVFRHVASGACWDDEDLADIQLGDGRCKHCGAQVHCPAHVLWDCPVVNQHRKVKELEGVHSEHLPKAIAVGLPPALSSDFTSTPWVTQGDVVKIDDVPERVTNIISVDDAEAKQGLVQHLANSVHDKGVHPRARNLFTSIRDEQGAQCFATPWKCTVPAPAAINVYTDGSWLNPLKQFLGLGGAGVWWPNRYLDDKPSGAHAFRSRISEAEAELAHYR